MKKAMVIVIGAFLSALLSCSNDLNNLLDKKTSTQELNSAQYRYLAYMYSSTGGSKLNETAMEGLSNDENADNIQKVLNITLSFPLQLNETAQIHDPVQIQDWLNNYWWNSVPSGIQSFINENLEGEFDAGEIALNLAKFLDTPEGSIKLNEFLVTIKSKITSLIEFGGALENNELDETITGTLEESGSINDDTVLKSFAAMSYGMTIMQVASMIQNQINSRGLSQEMGVVSDALAEICALREDLESSMEIIENKIEMMDLINDPLFAVSYNKIQDAQTMLKEVQSQLKSLDGESAPQDRGSDRAAYLKNLLIIVNEYGTKFSNALQAAYDCQSYIKDHGAGNEITTNVWLKRETDGFHTNPGCLAACDSCWGGYVPGCIVCWSCDDKIVLDPVYYTIKQPYFFTDITVQNIALMRRMSLERLSLLAYVYTGNDLLKRRASFAKQDLEKLLKIKQGLNGLRDQINAYISSIEFDGGDAPFWMLYDSNGVVLATESSNLTEDQINAALRAAMTAFVDSNTFYRDYIIAANALVLNWEIQLNAHKAAGE